MLFCVVQLVLLHACIFVRPPGAGGLQLHVHVGG